MIHLIGPGSAGKSTVGRIVADLLRWPLRDLDRLFEERHGDIDEFIQTRGYTEYARSNVETYQSIEADGSAVIALSSGFMTYPDDIHLELPAIRQMIATLSSTFVLLPSLDLEECVIETVRRQLERPIARHRSVGREEDVIRERFPIYMALPVRKLSTMRQPVDVADEIVSLARTSGGTASFAWAHSRHSANPPR